ncbi:uncharacterized protein LOC135213130 [Macrobrachium nipponense]|uniref:uncharacterized protein LOC135213130 n=1 Tax=Macrobrachium nipponense TaxID=159736 RepID=UPI0030C7D6C8
MEVHLKKAIVVLLVTFSSATYDFVVKPEFGEKAKDLNITAYVGQTSRLPCTVKHLSGKRVSWIRQRDLQVLSTGRHTFSTDLRISVLPGTRFKLRRPRDLVLQGHLQSHVSQGATSESPGYPAVGVRELKTSSFIWFDPQLEDEEKEEEEEVRELPENFVAGITSRKSLRDSVVLSDEAGLSRGGGDAPGGRLSPRDKKKTKRGRRSIHHYNYKRQKKNYWFKEDLQWEVLAPQNDYYDSPSSPGGQKRSKKALLPPQSHNNQGYTQLQSLQALGAPPSSTRGQAKEQNEALKKETNPIAIYPQGPISVASDSKNLKLAPNYIDGVWEPEDYTLQIKYTKPQDAGTYICQINTEPRITQAVTLRVVKMKAEILSRRELFVKAGNPVKLSCRVNHGALSPGFILWYKGERLVEYENSGGRIQVQTEAGGVSHLLLNNALPEDSSNYTCSPAGGEPASLILNVIVDERQAAMQQGNHCPSLRSQTSTVLLGTTLLMGHLLSSYPAGHLQPISTYFFPSGVFFGMSYFVGSCPVKAALFVLLFTALLFACADGDLYDEGQQQQRKKNSSTSSSSSSFCASFFRYPKGVSNVASDLWRKALDPLLPPVTFLLQRLRREFLAALRQEGGGVVSSRATRAPLVILIIITTTGIVVCMMCVFMFLGRVPFVSDVI